MPGMASCGNSMSTTGPVTRAMRPTPALVVGAFSAGAVVVMGSSLFLGAYFAETRASAPPTISEICWVISAWRALFASRVYSRMSLSALSVADFMAF